MPSKIVANEGVGINLPVYRFNTFLGHYQGFSVAVEISVKFLRETLHTNKVFLIFLRKKLKKFSSQSSFRIIIKKIFTFKVSVPVIWLDEPAFIIIYYPTVIINPDIKTSLQELNSKNFGKISRNFTKKLRFLRFFWIF